jgi:hypothetical protein
LLTRVLAMADPLTYDSAMGHMGHK